MEQQNIPGIGHFRAGHFKEPIGLEEDESDLYLTYMEKSPATKAFTPARNFGVMAWDTVDDCQDASWFLGIFAADSPDSPDSTGLWRSDDNDWSYDARVAVLPYYDEPSNGRYLVHLGGSYSFRHIGGLTSGATYNQNVAYNPLNGLAQFSYRFVGRQPSADRLRRRIQYRRIQRARGRVPDDLGRVQLAVGILRMHLGHRQAV